MFNLFTLRDTTWELSKNPGKVSHSRGPQDTFTRDKRERCFHSNFDFGERVAKDPRKTFQAPRYATESSEPSDSFLKSFDLWDAPLMAKSGRFDGGSAGYQSGFPRLR